MHKDFGAFRAKLSLAVAVALACGSAFAEGVAVCYEKRDEPTLKSVGEALDKIATAFDEYKKVNDQRLEAIKSGSSTSDLEAKLAKMDAHMDALTEAKSRLEKVETKLSRPGAFGNSGGDGEKGSKESVEYKTAFLSWVRNPQDTELRASLQQKSKALRAVEAKAFGGDDGFETRATQAVTSTGSAGGFAMPEVIERAIARLSVDISPIRQIATVRTVGSPDYKELFDINGAAFEWVGEGDTRNQTNTPDLAECAPTFGMASAKPQASEESLDDLFFNVEDWLTGSGSESMSAGEGAAFVSGNGTKKPTGFLAGPTPVTTADAARAFGTLQYIASGQAAAMPTSADVFYDLIYSLRARYRANARWVTQKLVLAAMRKYKDSQNQYLWQPSLIQGQPATFLGYGITEAEDMPSIAANAFPVAFGDFKEGYLIADRVGMRMTRDEITTPGFVKFYIRKRVGGKLRNTQAIKLLKISAA
ncbi:MAG: phage major capsid protein [Paucibacter sp.]|nr:phage major capsid protein [Roseateles sp.]